MSELWCQVLNAQKAEAFNACAEKPLKGGPPATMVARRS